MEGYRLSANGKSKREMEVRDRESRKDWRCIQKSESRAVKVKHELYIPKTFMALSVLSVQYIHTKSIHIVYCILPNNISIIFLIIS